MEEKIIRYLTERYAPETIIVYGSFADGSNNAASDFDALVIADGPQLHDSTEIDGTVLDVFIYPPKVFQAEYDPGEFIQVFDGNIKLDKNGTAQQLKANVISYIEALPVKTDEDLAQSLAWCRKMLARTSRGDAEGFYRHHWLLTDSLEIYFDLHRKHSFGPKKSLRYMERTDPESFEVYSHALKSFSHKALSAWIDRLESMI